MDDERSKMILELQLESYVKHNWMVIHCGDPFASALEMVSSELGNSWISKAS